MSGNPEITIILKFKGAELAMTPDEARALMASLRGLIAASEQGGLKLQQAPAQLDHYPSPKYGVQTAPTISYVLSAGGVAGGQPDPIPGRN